MASCVSAPIAHVRRTMNVSLSAVLDLFAAAIVVFSLIAAGCCPLHKAVRLVSPWVVGGALGLCMIAWSLTHSVAAVALIGAAALLLLRVVANAWQAGWQAGVSTGQAHAWEEITRECHRLGVAGPPQPGNDALPE